MTADCNEAVEFEGKIGPDPVSFDDPAVTAKKVPDNAVAEKTGFDADGSSLFVDGESDGSVGAAAEDGVHVADDRVEDGAAEMNAGDFSGDGSSDKEGEVAGLKLNGGYPDPAAPEVEVETDGTGEACVAASEEVVPESINDEEPAVAEEEADDSGDADKVDAAQQSKLSPLGGEIDTVECPAIVFDESAVVVPELIKDEEPVVEKEEADDSADADKVDAAEQPKLSPLGGEIDTYECPAIVLDESAVIVPELIKDEEPVVVEEEAEDSADGDIGEYEPTIVFDESLVVVPELINEEEPVVAVEEADNSVDADKVDEAEQLKPSPLGGETDAIEYRSNGKYQPTIVFDESPVIVPELIKDEEPVVVEEEADDSGDAGRVDAMEQPNLSPLEGEINAVKCPSDGDFHSTTDMVSAVECPLSDDDQSNIVRNETPVDGEDQSTIVDPSNCEEQLTLVPDAASVDKVMVVEFPFNELDQSPSVCDEAPVEEEVLVDECPFNGEDQLTTGHDENSVDKALMVKCPITGEDQSPIVCDEIPVVDKALVVEHPLNGEDQSTAGHDDTSVDEKLVFECPLNAEEQPPNVFYEVSMVEEVSVVNNQSTIMCDWHPVVDEVPVVKSSVDGEEEPRVVDVVPIEEPAEEVMEPKVETTYFSIGSLEFETVIINGSPAVRGVKLSYMPADDMDLGRNEVCNKNECLNSSPVEDDNLSNSPVANFSVGTAFVTETVAEGDLGQQEIENQTAVVINEVPEVSGVKLSDAPIDDSKLESLKVGNENEGFGNSIVDEVLSGSVDVVTIEVAETGPASAEVAMGIENSPVCSVDSAEVEPTVCDGPIESYSQMVNVYTANNVESCSIEDRELVSEAVVLPVEEASALPVNDVNIGSKVGEDESVPKGKSINIDTECNRYANTADDGKPIAEEAINVDTAVQSLSEETNDHSDMEKKGPFYIIRVPRFKDDKLRERENILQARVDEFTESRDIVGTRLNEQKNIQKRCWDELVAVRLEESAARDALNQKNDELEPVRARMKMLKCAMDIDEISDKIRCLEHKMQHETIPLDEEKQLLREIKRLKSDHEQRRLGMGSKAELQEAFEQRDEINKRFHVLSQEHETLKSALSRCVAISKAAWKRHDDESKNFQILRIRHKAANDLRQEEYLNLQKLKSERSEKNAVFYKYRDDKNLIRHYQSTGDREKLMNHCRNQVERTMELWNKNDEFRNEYVKNNMPSTLRRLGTPDGRSLGPDEQPQIHVNPVIYYKVSSTVPTPTLETVHDNAAEKTKSESTPKDAQKSQPADKPKAPKKAAVVVESTVLAAVSKGDEEEKEKERKPTKEEEEAARKAAEQARKEEELRKEEAAAELKEQHRLEQKAKAKEAEERKRRAAEKAQAKADLKAKLEAEQREKQREKRQRKKERKRAAAVGSLNAITEGEITSETESSQSEVSPPSETKDKAPAPATVTKKSTRPPVVVKQTKVRPLPPPLRNRNRRKLQTWIWFAVIAVSLVMLVLASNYGYPMKLGLLNFRI